MDLNEKVSAQHLPNTDCFSTESQMCLPLNSKVLRNKVLPKVSHFLETLASLAKEFLARRWSLRGILES